MARIRTSDSPTHSTVSTPNVLSQLDVLHPYAQSPAKCWNDTSKQVTTSSL